MEPAGPARVERRLAAILAADVAGVAPDRGRRRRYARPPQGAPRRDLSIQGSPIITGRIVKTTGDGLLVEFASVVDAFRMREPKCRRLSPRAMLPVATARPHRVPYRVQCRRHRCRGRRHLWRRRQRRCTARGLAEPGGICVSARVQEDAVGRLDFAFEDIGEQTLKNIRGLSGSIAATRRPSGPSGRILALPSRTNRRSRCCPSPI